jgi:hypothetical protein
MDTIIVPAWCGGACVLLSIMMVSISQSLEFNLSLNLLLPVTSRPKKPAKPVIWVWVSNRYLKHDLYPYPSNPYPHTHVGLQTHDMHYYPPSVITRPSPSLSTTPIIPIPDLFPMTSLDISNVQLSPKPYHPPAARWTSYIITQHFDVWHVTTCSTPLLRSGMHVTIVEYGVVDIWESRWFSTSEWVVYQCRDCKTGRRLIYIAIGWNWVEGSTWDMVLASFALWWGGFIYFISSLFSL